MSVCDDDIIPTMKVNWTPELPPQVRSLLNEFSGPPPEHPMVIGFGTLYYVSDAERFIYIHDAPFPNDAYDMRTPYIGEPQHAPQ